MLWLESRGAMSEFEKQFEAFNLSTERADQLRGLAVSDFLFPKRAGSVVVETVLIKDGDRRVIKSETLSAKLV
jgi:hypothetical protein